MHDLLAWLGEQVDDDERTAQAARDAEFCKDGRWAAKGPFEEGLGSIHSEAGEAILGEEESVPFAVADHASRHDPARVLREVQARRQVLDMVQVHADAAKSSDEMLSGPARAALVTLRPVVQGLVAVYADRPGLHEEWQP